MAAKRDYYEVLGVDRGAGDAEVKKAFRRLARQLHPDVSEDELVSTLACISQPRYAPHPFNNAFVAQAGGVLAGLVFNFTLSNKMVFRASA